MKADIDIVARLRERATWAAANGRTLVTIDCSDGASEIERLREQTQRLQGAIDTLRGLRRYDYLDLSQLRAENAALRESVEAHDVTIEGLDNEIINLEGALGADQ